MDELGRSEFGRALPIFEGIDYSQPAVFTVLEGTQAGRIFVDRRDRPAVALIWSDFCYLAGNTADEKFNADLLELLRAEIMPRTEHILFYVFADAWRGLLEDMLRGKELQRVRRTLFDWDPALFTARHTGWQAHVPEGYAVRRADIHAAAQIHGITDLWGTLENFIAKGFAFCAFKDESRVSSCQTVFVGGGTAETGVGTEEPYRRQGLATLAACAYLDHCLDTGIDPKWGCYYNPASEALAQKLGFVNRREVEVMYLRVPKDRQDSH